MVKDALFDAALRNELRLLIQDVVREEMKIAALERGGYLSEYSEECIENHKWLKLQRERADRASTAFILALATAIAGGLATVLWLGVKQLMHGTK